MGIPPCQGNDARLHYEDIRNTCVFLEQKVICSGLKAITDDSVKYPLGETVTEQKIKQNSNKKPHKTCVDMIMAKFGYP